MYTVTVHTHSTEAGNRTTKLGIVNTVVFGMFYRALVCGIKAIVHWREDDDDPVSLECACMFDTVLNQGALISAQYLCLCYGAKGARTE